MNERDQKLIDALLAEYTALRAEVISYTQRLDTTISIYLTALAAIIGTLIQPAGSTDAGLYLVRVSQEPTLSLAMMLIGVLNSTLIIRMQSLYAGLLAIAQYTACAIAPAVRSTLRADVLKWDTREPSSLKAVWLRLRTAAQVLFAIFALAVSVAIIVATTPSIGSPEYLLITYLVQLMVFGYCVYAVVVSKQASGSFVSDFSEILPANKRGRVEP